MTSGNRKGREMIIETDEVGEKAAKPVVFCYQGKHRVSTIEETNGKSDSHQMTMTLNKNI